MIDNRTAHLVTRVLRHRPKLAGVSLDEHGWVDVNELLNGMNKTTPITRAELEEIVATDNKNRFSFSEDGTRIRANQGHSVDVDVELEQLPPPEILYHGTAEGNIDSIRKQGLLPMKRLYVHLSADTETARTVGARHGRPRIFLLDARRMAEDGFEFFRSVNGVWLTRRVPPEYLTLTEEN